MKEETYKFVKTYIEFCKESKSELALKDVSTNSELGKALKALKKADQIAYNTVVALERDKALLEYLKIMKKYVDKRRFLGFKYTYVSRKSGIPISSLKRVEDFHSIPRTSMILAMMKVVNIELKSE